MPIFPDDPESVRADYPVILGSFMLPKSNMPLVRRNPAVR